MAQYLGCDLADRINVLVLISAEEVKTGYNTAL